MTLTHLESAATRLLCQVVGGPWFLATCFVLAFAIAEPQSPAVFVAIGLGKLLKYGFVCWLASRFPDHMAPGLLSLQHYRWHSRRSGRA